MTTGVIVSDDFRKHDPGKGHPESYERMDAVARAIADPLLASKLERVNPKPAEKEHILLVHWERLYDEVMATRGKERTYLDSDTVASPATADVAHLAVGAVLTGIDRVMSGTPDAPGAERKLENAFAFSRPPGHHAKPDKAMGFCFFNNVAVGAMYALKRYQMRRILVVDFDVHHGNGTQKAFYTSPEVLYLSTHQSPHYPGTGSIHETGKDEGEGYTLNVPMPAGMGDREYLRVFRDVLMPVGREYKPELVLVSAGFDAHREDPLGGMELSSAGYAAIATEILGLAREACGGRAVFALEGGYNLRALSESIAAVLGVMSGGGAGGAGDPGDAAEDLVNELRALHREYWTSLRRS
jgi:acetoin utilization deacetylase AcuC-like enzyme